MRSGYRQVKVVESDITKTAFRIRDGHHELVVDGKSVVDGSCVDIIETAKCLETWYGTDPETGAGTKTISK